ncbi:MAG: hypothetical protein ACXVEE_04300 [Polyangiales bacterium]
MTVRLIKADGGRAPLARVETSVRKIDAATWNARIEAEKTIAAAREEAQAIVAKAHAEAREVTAKAESAGRAEAAAMWIAARAEAGKQAQRATEVVIAATRAVAERALGRALATDDQLLSSWANEAVATLAGARRIALHAHPRTLARLDAELPVNKVEAELPEGTILVRSELGDVRLELATQVEALTQAIAEVLAAEVHRRA